MKLGRLSVKEPTPAWPRICLDGRTVADLPTIRGREIGAALDDMSNRLERALHLARAIRANNRDDDFIVDRITEIEREIEAVLSEDA